MIEFELDIPTLTQYGICMDFRGFSEVKEINSRSMIDELLMIEMLILLNDTFNKGAEVVVQLTNAVTLLVQKHTNKIMKESVERVRVKHYKHYIDALTGN